MGASDFKIDGVKRHTGIPFKIEAGNPLLKAKVSGRFGEKGSDEDRYGRRIGACGNGLEPQNRLPGIAWLSTAFHVGDERMLFSIEFHADPHIESRIFLHGPIFNDLGLILGMRLSRRSSSAAPRSSTAFTELAT